MSELLTSENLAQTDFREGAKILIDKPEGWTSFDVVNKLRGALRHHYQTKKIKVGHAGTLDPIATGLLILCTGKQTTTLGDLQGLDKEYSGSITFGGTTPSYDREMPVEHHADTAHLTLHSIQAKASTFLGWIDQVPPMYSAIKVAGRPLYQSARKGYEVQRDARRVRIDRFDIVRYEEPVADFIVTCSKGTYIRSLAHDLGQLAGTGAYLTALRRTKIGPWSVTDAWTLEGLVAQINEMGIH